MMRMGIKYLTAHSCSTEGGVTAQQQQTGHPEPLKNYNQVKVLAVGINYLAGLLISLELLCITHICVILL